MSRSKKTPAAEPAAVDAGAAAPQLTPATDPVVTELPAVEADHAEELADALESVRRTCGALHDTAIVHVQARTLSLLCDAADAAPAARSAVTEVRGAIANAGPHAYRSVYVGVLRTLAQGATTPAATHLAATPREAALAIDAEETPAE
ncbi:MAG: hypothetical protein KF774_17775 [Planctomyces sp.]|nr:hypothetical protein [Planctomyces sp.]